MKNEGKPDRRGMFSALRILGMPVFLGCPGGFIGYSLLSILHSMVLTFETISQQQVFDRTAELAAGTAYFRDAVMSVLVLGAVCVGSQILGAIVNIVPDMFLDKIDGKLSYEIHQKVARMLFCRFRSLRELQEFRHCILRKRKLSI